MTDLTDEQLSKRYPTMANQGSSTDSNSAQSAQGAAGKDSPPSSTPQERMAAMYQANQDERDQQDAITKAAGDGAAHAHLERDLPSLVQLYDAAGMDRDERDATTLQLRTLAGSLSLTTSDLSGFVGILKQDAPSDEQIEAWNKELNYDLGGVHGEQGFKSLLAQTNEWLREHAPGVRELINARRIGSHPVLVRMLTSAVRSYHARRAG